MFDTKSTNRVGNDGFIWFFGVVEDINDPLQLGRVRVRIVGDHTQSLKNIPKESLPWAYLLNNNLSSSMQGIGDSPTGLYVLGSWVTGFYWDGIDKQQPVITHSFGGIPESIPWTPKKAEEEETGKQISPKTGFQDPNEEFPMGHAIFEQDTNRLARNSPIGHAFEIPEDLVPKQEEMIEDGLCPENPDYAKKYYDKFDEAFVRKFAHGEEGKHSSNDTVIGSPGSGTSTLKVKPKDDDKCQYHILTNDHPFTIYKFINRERFIPKCKVFADPMHREVWHEPDNPWATNYPYNKVWEGYHKEGSVSINNPKNKFVSEAYGYNKTIENYDGSNKEGLHRKQKCGIGSWGLGEEWDSTEGAQRYHRFHPSGNYFEIDNEGNEVRKIYGESFEIDLGNRSILIKGDWNVTVEGDQNVLVEKNYNLQVMGDFNTDVRGNIETHCDNDIKQHNKGDRDLRIDGNDEVLIRGSRNTTVLVKDYTESQEAERHADTIIRKGATSIEDEGFITFDIKAHEMNVNVCTLNEKYDTVNRNATTVNDKVKNFNEIIENYSGEFKNHLSLYETFTEKMASYESWIADWTLHTDNYLLTFASSYEVVQSGFTCDECVPDNFDHNMNVILGNVSYCENECIHNKCKPLYHNCVEIAKNACMTTLIDPRTLEEYTRFDWEKYHASIDSCRRSYDDCVNQCSGCPPDDICSPSEKTPEWKCMPSHDPNCPVGDKTWEFYNCDCKCDIEAQEVKIDPWIDVEQEKP